MRLLAPLMLAFVPALAAQEIEGVLFDSLVTFAPVPNALVTIDGRPERARTDGLGRFRFSSLPAGQWLIRHQTPWLDSVALPPLTTPVAVRDGARTPLVELTTPSRASFQRALCGTTLDDGAGILRGELRHADGRPLGNVFIGALWAEYVVTTGNRATATTTLVGVVDTSGSSGLYALCGVPRGTTVMLRAGDDSLGTGELLVSVHDRLVQRFDLVVGPREAHSSVSGRVVTERGLAIGSAVVSVPGDSALGGRSGDDGRFAIAGVPPRTVQIFVRAIGFLPQSLMLDPSSGAVDLGDVVLQAVPQDLAAVRVTAQARTLEELEFQQRRRTGNGTFLVGLHLLPNITATLIASRSSAVVAEGGRYPRTLMRIANETCRPRFYLDGVDWGLPRDGVEEAILYSNATRIEIHQASSMPPQYSDYGGCGVILVWTR